MKQMKLPKRVEDFLSRQLSGTVFTWQEIMQMTIPYVLDSLSIMLIGMLITALISKNGDASVAAVSLVYPITALIMCMFNGVGAGGTVVVAQCCGTGDRELVCRASGQIIWLTVLIGTLTCLPFLIFPRQVLLLLYPAAQQEVLDKGSIYLAGCAVSILVFTLYTAIFSILRGLGESKKCLALSIIINVAYLVFSIICLNWLNMDIRGSVLALLTARIIGAVAAVVLLFFWHPPIPLKLRQVFSYDLTLLKSTLHVSIPFALEQIFISCGNIVAERCMTELGTAAVAIHAVANSLLGVLTAAAMAAGSLAVTVVGRCIGAQKLDEARWYGKRMVWVGVVLLGLAAAVFYPLMPLLLRQYNPTPEAYAMSQRLLWYSLLPMLLFWSMSNTMPYTLRAANDTMYPSVFSLVVMWLVNIALGYYLALPLGMGLMGVWIALWASWAVRAVGFYFRFRGKRWLRKAPLEEAAKS